MNMLKISVAMRMNAYAVLALLSVLLIAGISLSGVHELAKMHEHSFIHSKAAMFAAEGSSLAAETYQIMAEAVINLKPEENVRNLDAIKTKGQLIFERLQASAETEQQKQLVGEAIVAHGKMATLFEQRVRPLLWQANPDHVAIMSADAAIKAQGAIVKDTLARFSESMSQTAIGADTDFVVTKGDIFKRDKTIAAVVFLLLLAASWWITRSIHKQLGGDPWHLAEVVHKMAGGDMAANIHLAEGDRSSILAKVKEIADRFSQIISNIHTAELSLERAAAQVGFAAQMLSDSTREQAAKVIETSSSIEQMTVSIYQNRKNADATDDMAVLTAREVAEEKRAINDAVGVIKNIAGKIDDLNNFSKQSKLLALDALIEVARTGNHGSRIKPMTEKICELLDRSRGVTKEIMDLTCNGVSLAERAFMLIEKMEKKLIITSDLAQEVSCSSSEQSRGVTQINSAIGNLYQAAQQNAFASAQLAVTAEEMDSLTEQLHNIMLFFKLGKSVILARNQARNSLDAVQEKLGKMQNFPKANFMRATDKHAA